MTVPGGDRDYSRPGVDVEPSMLFVPYTSSIKRAPLHEPVPIEHTLSELTAPVDFRGIAIGHDDLTTQGAEPPIGEQIIVAGRVLDEDGKAVPGVLIEVWQANAAGRYVHEADTRPAALDPNFIGRGRCLSDDDGGYQFRTIRPAPYPGRSHHNAWRPAHIHFSVLGPALAARVVTQMYFPGDPLLAYDTIFLAVPEPARGRLIAALDFEVTEPDVALGYRFDLVIRGRDATPQSA